MMQAIRFAVIGCGRMGIAHSRRLAADSRSEVVALFDRSPEAAKSIRDLVAPKATVYRESARLLEDEAVDAAVICTPTRAHAEQVRQAADRGWHVLCEKPLAATHAEIESLVLLSEARTDQQFMLAYQRRFHAPYRRLRHEIQSGKHGPVRAVVSVNAERWQQTIAGTWRDDPDINIGGFAGDAGSHKIDAVFFVTGLMPTQVFATSCKCGSQVEIVTSVSALLSRDVPLTMAFTGNTNSFQEELFVHCENADLIVRGEQLWIAQDNAISLLETPSDEAGPNSITNPVTGFLTLLTEETSNIAPFSCARPVFDFTQAILTSVQSGKSVQLPGIERDG